MTRQRTGRARPVGPALAAAVLLLVGATLSPAAQAPVQDEYTGILINNVTLIDGTGRPPVAGISVMVRGDRIVAIGPGPF
ncbi:MAG: hypothetical protein PVJ51_02035, partial [Acidobacteriota bacterium]